MLKRNHDEAFKDGSTTIGGEGAGEKQVEPKKPTNVTAELYIPLP